MKPIPPFTEALKFEFPELTKDSVVIDCGAYEGNWSREIARKYGARVFAYEPCREFYSKAVNANAPFENVRVFNHGIGAITRVESFGVNNDSSGLFDKGGETREKVEIVNLFVALSRRVIDEVALLKLNIEGMEYEVMEMITADWIVASRFRNILIQWHGNAPAAESRRVKIHQDLMRTHELVWGIEPNFWQLYSLRK